MKPLRIVHSLLAFLILTTALTLTNCGGGGANSTTGDVTGGGGTGSNGGGGGLSAIQHIIVMAQENRSTDTYLGSLNDYRKSRGLSADFDGMPANAQNPYPFYTGFQSAFHLQTMCIENTSAGWLGAHYSFNSRDPKSDTPLMDGFVIAAASVAVFAGENDTQGVRAMGYYTADDLPYHYWLATQFATSDRWFAGGPLETQPNRMYLMAATSAGHAHTPQAPVNGTKTIFDELEAANVSWKIYVTDVAASSTLNFFQPFGKQHQANIVPLSEYFTDVQNGTLPQVAYIEPGLIDGTDEHPGIGINIQVGAAESAKVINALIQSPSWKDSVFILTFDEGGGLYDHVPPATGLPNPDGILPMDLFSDDTPGDFTRWGFRVPLFVVSPFAKPGFISHTPTDFTAVLKFIENRFNLSSLTKRDAMASNMSEYFDFGAPNMTPPAAPTQPTKGPCYDGLP